MNPGKDLIIKVIIFEKLSDLHQYCADTFVNQIKLKKDSVLGFATGVSPLDTYKLLVDDYQKNNRDWSQITTFNLDEFVGIDPNHREAFIAQMSNNLFKHLNINPKNINIPSSIAANPEQEARDYENKIRAIGGVDLQYISLGVNGHMAYNEPGTDFNSNTHVANLTQDTIIDMVNKGKFATFFDSPAQAITVGIQTLLNYTKKAMMVSFGLSKAEVTRAMLEDKPNSKVTASYLQLHKDCVFILDNEAASLLSEKTLKLAERR
ncbi:glucosamine-6-phosphate deaminase [Mycoplasmopsis agassizii]|uniref:glucosamine-6-phosphate deaminase n=1 Tax=Mycoplasmopsis agassizii TaxID=33922 RepID=UPI003526D83B